jgi:DNA-binding Lrp family transcriptional regulator
LFVEIAEIEAALQEDEQRKGWTREEYASATGISPHTAGYRLRDYLQSGKIKVVGVRKSPDSLGRMKGRAAEYRLVSDDTQK